MPGKIITFYSYKGGAGRSMALANVAWILASSGKRVLAIDWDLEAPGLHRYFRPFLLDKDLSSSEGILDLVLDYAVEAITPAESDSERSKDWYLPYANVLRYAVTLKWTFPESGRLDFIPAGQQVPSYASRMNSFDWRNFYDRLGGSAFLESVKGRMRDEYDYILIDSRTGVSDTSGICTIQMPDILVVCFTLNNQSIDGAATVTTSVRDQRGDEGVFIYPVPMRIDNAEKRKLDLRREYAKSVFGMLPTHLTNEERRKYLKEVEYPYVPYYAYEEILATFGDSPGKLNTVLAATERLTSFLTGGEVTSWIAPKKEESEEVLAFYEETKPVKGTTGVRLDTGDETTSVLGEPKTYKPKLIRLVNTIRRRWQRSILSNAGALFFAFITLFVLMAFAFAYNQFRDRQKIALLQQQLSAIQSPQPLSESPQPLSGRVEEVKLLQLQPPSGDTQVFIHLAIRNYSSPTKVSNYVLHIKHAFFPDVDMKLRPVELTETLTLPQVGDVQVIDVHPQESMMRITNQTVGEGGIVRGWLRFNIPTLGFPYDILKRDGTRYIVSFSDGSNKQYQTTYETGF